MPLKIIGAGFGRTGTASLKRSLELLGLGPCYHMEEIMRNPRFATHWAKVARGESVDWEEIYEGYCSAVDWPTATYWRQLADHYPSAKVILTVRDPQKWYASLLKTIMSDEKTPDDEMTEQLPADLQADFMTMHRAGPRFGDEQQCLELFARHIEEVKQGVPKDRLLVLDVAEGWEPLCAFLGVDIPNEPFPKLNAPNEFGRASLQR